MKISAINLNTNAKTNRNKSRSIAFKSGLPHSFIRYVENANVRAIESRFSQMGIKADFAGCKVVAACAEKTAEIFRKYRLALPKKIKFLQIDKKDVAQCLYAERHVQINSEYKEFYDIRLLNKAEESRKRSQSTEHFLATFLHEFAHNAHFQNISKLHSLKKAEEIMSGLASKKIRLPWTKGKGKHPMNDVNEYMAELITKNIVGNLDGNLNLRSYPRLDIFVPDAKDSAAVIAMKHTNRLIWDGDLAKLSTQGVGIKG